jgi:hypothetical protein
MYPRVKATAVALRQQFTLSLALHDAAAESPALATRARALRSQLADRRSRGGAASDQLAALDRKLAELAGPETTGRGGRGGGRGGRGGGPPAPPSFGGMAAEFAAPLNAIQEADEPPTASMVVAANEKLKTFAELKAKWAAILRTDVPALNVALKAAGAQPVVP